MAETFLPRLDILPAAQLRLWHELGEVAPNFILYGGTAIALQLGHRGSEDFHFFAFQDIDPDRLLADLGLLAGAQVTQRARNTLGVIVDRDGPVRVSFFGLPALRSVAPALRTPDNGIPVAALIDLAGTKCSVVQVRSEAKDYLDLDAILLDGRIGLPGALASAVAIYGEQFNPQITLKALAYFDDGNLWGLPDATKARLVAAAAAVDLDRLPRSG